MSRPNRAIEAALGLRINRDAIRWWAPADDWQFRMLAPEDAANRLEGADRALSDISYVDHFRNELHDLLCAERKYTEERKKLLEEFRPGQSTFAPGVATVLAPHVGGTAEVLVGGVAAVLTIAGQVGLRAWCAQQAQRRERARRSRVPAAARVELELEADGA